MENEFREYTKNRKNSEENMFFLTEFIQPLQQDDPKRTRRPTRIYYRRT